MQIVMRNAHLVLEDGAVFTAVAVGAPGIAAGEACFTTSMAGYEESVTDPSYIAQVLVFSSPLIGNSAIEPYAGLGGLTVFFDPRRPYWTDLYTNGAGATWAQDTHWDDYLLSIDTEAATTLR